jgi:uncharacterized delta-60 repeat protein
MFNKILTVSFIIGFSFLACDVKIEDEKFTCDPNGDPCPDGMKCIQSGTELNTYCYDQSVPACGDGELNPETGEQCDTTAPNSEDLIDTACGTTFLGIPGCTTNCTLICDPCGNGIIENGRGEVCDGDSLEETDCDQITDSTHTYHGGTLSCNANCQYNFDACTYCGDGTIQGTFGEECDGTNFGTGTCGDMGSSYHDAGSLSCDEHCRFIADECEQCGDGTIQEIFEECDNENIGSYVCDNSYFTGIPTCSGTCIITNIGCTNIVQWGTEYEDKAYGVAIDSNDNIYITGETYASAGNNDIFLTKYSPEGVQLWNVNWGTDANDVAYGLAIDSSDYIYITGATWGDIGGTNPGESDIFLTKFSSDGSRLWNRQWGTSKLDRGNGIAIDSNNNIFITGETGGDLDGNSPEGIADFLIKCNSDGSELWIVQGDNTPISGKGNGVAVDSSDNIYITGTNLDATNITKMFIMKYNNDGIPSWNTTWSSNGLGKGYGITIDSSDNIYVTGGTEISGGTGAAFLNKYTFDSSTIRWNRIWGNNNEYGKGISTDSNGFIYVTGAIYNANPLPDISLTKYSSDGTPIWDKFWTSDSSGGEYATEVGHSVATDSNDYLFITGYTDGDLVGINIGNEDSFLIRITVDGSTY